LRWAALPNYMLDPHRGDAFRLEQRVHRPEGVKLDRVAGVWLKSPVSGDAADGCRPQADRLIDGVLAAEAF
jgi:hypothetical protein